MLFVDEATAEVGTGDDKISLPLTLKLRSEEVPSIPVEVVLTGAVSTIDETWPWLVCSSEVVSTFDVESCVTDVKIDDDSGERVGCVPESTLVREVDTSEMFSEASEDAEGVAEDVAETNALVTSVSDGANEETKSLREWTFDDTLVVIGPVEAGPSEVVIETVLPTLVDNGVGMIEDGEERLAVSDDTAPADEVDTSCPLDSESVWVKIRLLDVIGVAETLVSTSVAVDEKNAVLSELIAKLDILGTLTKLELDSTAELLGTCSGTELLGN